MKANYNAPKMEISYFRIENVITTSGTEPQKTAVEQAQSLINFNEVSVKDTFKITL